MEQLKTPEPNVKLPQLEGFIPADRIDVCYLASAVDTEFHKILIELENMRVRALDAENKYYQLLVQIANEKISAVQREYDQTQVNISFLDASFNKTSNKKEAIEETEDKA